jgi:hypothetical protein
MLSLRTLFSDRLEQFSSLPVSKVYLGPCVQLYLLAETPQLPTSPRIWAHIRERYWSDKTEDISLEPPASAPL